MTRLTTLKAPAVIALCCSVGGIALVGCDDSSNADAKPSESSSAERKAADAEGKLLTGTEKITVAGHSVNVSCSGTPADDRPVIVLLSGGGDDLKKMAGLQKTLSKKDRVCSYDRLGQGASDKPSGPQTFKSTGKILTGVLHQVAGDRPVVLAGHSLGGIIAARYAPDHQDKVKGLALLDATSPTNTADVTHAIPASATGEAAKLRAQSLAIFKGKNPEQLRIPDGEVRAAGDIPVAVVKHGKPYLAAVPEYGPALERSWTQGQREWLKLSGNSRLSVAEKSGHYIYVDQPDVAVKAVQRVAAQATTR
ncbi:alpha/beta fold hydrolase [Streptomyces smyrnaeus]|uniref:Alpha/beta fold hydrolase n=1 Tax=Streptomyces smyrnaeus TaxID=1387713 RepID=A0ABS3XQ45_9ACTN|nr:alpha/beta fold hydrolase [Streptomyces smyrnaeus]MBO8197516.1 alpha/beta fold hydrolase [Streptomyces smyrnaeus]